MIPAAISVSYHCQSSQRGIHMGIILDRSAPGFTRREWLRTAALAATAPLANAPLWARQSSFAEPARVPYAGSDDALLEEIEKSAFEYFWNEGGGASGQVK